jgi:hypothetical protein
MTDRDWTAAEAKAFRKSAAEYVRAVYVAERRHHEAQRTTKESGYGSYRMPRWDGGVDRKGHRHRMVWGRIFDFCVANRYPIYEYIKAQFDPTARVPQPNQLQSRAAVTKYKEYAPRVLEQKRKELKDHQTRFKVAVWSVCASFGQDKSTAARNVLLTDTSLSPLFRYTVGYLAGDDKVTDALLAAALMQFMSARTAYETTWGSLIPTTLVQEAQAVSDNDWRVDNERTV